LRPIPLGTLSPQPLVSVLVPNYNYAPFIGDALESVRQQSYERFEVIVCDDASSDRSVEIIDSFARSDPRVQLIRHRTNRGQAAAFNSAFERSTGEVICFLDSDDTFGPRKLDAVVAALRDGDTGAIVHPLMVVDRSGNAIQRIPGFTRFESGWLAPRVVRRGGRWRWVPTTGVTMRRAVAEASFPMPEEGFSTSADTFFLMLLPLLTPVGALDDVLGTYRRHGANVYARSRIDPDRARSFVGNLRRSVDAVNARMSWNDGTPTLDIEDNLKYRDLVFQTHLFDAATRRSSLTGAYFRLMSGYRRDDLYGPLQKGWAAAMYLVAIALPPSARAGWLSGSLSASAAKERIRQLLGPRSAARVR
jgi:glycosyltransferase involved in cell wall biosynthesis